MENLYTQITKFSSFPLMITLNEQELGDIDVLH